MPRRVQGDVTIDVSRSPYESGFKFNTLPFGGMTIDADNAVRIGSATEIKLVPLKDRAVILGTTSTTAGSLPTPSASLRGALFFMQQASGTADTLHLCIRNAGGTYEWKQVQLI